MHFESGANVASWAVSAMGASASLLKKAYGHTTLRISSVKGNSPWIYNGWKGGGRGNVHTLSSGKILKGGSMLLNLYNIFDTGENLYSGKSSGAKGWFEFCFSIVSAATGAYGAAASFGYEVGKYKPLKAIFGFDSEKFVKKLIK